MPSMTKRIAFILLAILLALLPFNALLTTYIQFGLDIHLPVNAWKEVLVVLITMGCFVDMLLYRKKPRVKTLDLVIIAFFVLSLISAFFQTKELGRSLFGFKYDLEFLWLFFVLRQARLFGKTDVERLVRIALGAGTLAVLFALLQILILPKDILLLFGYSPNISSWVPGEALPMYHAVDQNADIPRIMSTLSGPNQFAAYLLILIGVTGAYSFLQPNKERLAWGLLFAASLICLWFTYSRSSYAAAAFMLLLGGIFFLRQKRVSRKRIAGILGIIVLLGIGIAAIKFEAVSQLFLRASSNQGHLERSTDGILYTLQNPFGHGIGNAGPASARFNADNIGWLPESWYLQISLELGIPGILLFLFILIYTLKELLARYRKQHSNTTLGLFLALLGISIMGIVLHAWEESAVALTLWALLGLELSIQPEKAMNSEVVEKLPQKSTIKKRTTSSPSKKASAPLRKATKAPRKKKSNGELPHT